MFRAFNLSSKYGRSKAEKILLTYQTFAISVKVPTPYTTQPPCHNCVAILGEVEIKQYLPITSIQYIYNGIRYQALQLMCILHFAFFVSFRLVTNLNPPKLRNRELYSP